MTVLKVPDTFKKIQDAIDKWQKGDVVRVATGNYKENIKLKPDVVLEGGFKSDFSVQNWDQWPSVIDGGKLDSVVVGANGAQLNGFTLRNGKAENGGGIYLNQAGMLIRNNTIEDNVAEFDGGGIYISGYPGFARSQMYLDIQNNTIRKNEASGIRGGWGGGICIRESKAGVRIHDNLIGGIVGEGNQAAACGGGICVLDTPVIDIQENRIQQNITQGHGGGVMIDGSSRNASLMKNKVHYNLAYGNFGGGVYLIGDMFIAKNDIKGNRIDNFRSGYGGGIAVHGYEYRYPTIENNFVYGNYADYGAGIHVDRVVRILIINNSIASNRTNPDVKAGVGGVYLAEGLCILQNNIIWDHNDDLYKALQAKCTLIHNDIEDGDGFGKLGNISADPKFVAKDDLHIQSTSAAINGGDPGGAPKDDIDDQQRSKITPDIGADEFADKK